MSTISYNPYDSPQAVERNPWPRLLLTLALALTGAALVGIVLLEPEAPYEGGESVPVRGVSQLVYPAKLERPLPQPLGDRWLAPAAAATAGGATFVLDTGNNRILKLDRAGAVAATIDATTDARLALSQPMALASDGERLYVANSLASEVVVLDPSGAVLNVIGLQPQAAGEGPPRPIGVAVMADGTIAVSDAANHRVLFLDGGGRVVRTVGTGVRAAGQEGFNVPGALTSDAEGNLYVVDILNGRVVQLGQGGAFVREFGRLGDTAGALARPKGVAVDGAGRVFVSDGLLAAVEVFSPDGAYLGVIGRRDPEDPTSGSLFQAPAGLWLDGDRLYVTDRFAGLMTFSLPGAD